MEYKKYKILLFSAVFAALSFLLTYSFGYLVRNGLPGLNWNYDISNKEKRVFTYDPPKNIGNPLLMLNNFDSNFYIGIASKGYEKEDYNTSTGLKRWAFYPLYPLSVSVISKLLGVSTEYGIFKIGLVVSNLCLFLFFVILFLLIRELGYSFEDWFYLLIFILVFPTSYFLNIFYSESMFLFLSATSLLLVLKRKYFYSSLLILLSSVTRNVGILLFIPLFIMIISDANIGLFRKMWKSFIYGFISILGVLIFFSYLSVITGDFLASVKIQSHWGRGDVESSFFPFKSLFLSFDNVSFSNTSSMIGEIDLIFSLVGIIAMFYFLSHIGKNVNKLALGVYFLTYLAFVTSTSLNTSIIRYLMSVVPLYFVILDLRKKNEIFYTSLIPIMAFFHTLFLVFFVLHIPSSGV